MNHLKGKQIAVGLFFICFAFACNNNKTVSEKVEIVKSDKNVEIDVSYNQLKGKEYSVINNAIKAYTDEHLSQYEEHSKDNFNEDFAPNKLTMYDTLYISEKYLSDLVKTYAYMGGAHGNSYSKSFVYSKEKNSLINISDIVQESDMPKLKEIVKAKLRKNLTSTDLIDDGVDDELGITPFCINDKGVLFIFNPYAVASYSEGIQEVLVTYQEFNFKL